jgi:hypothetical protein
MPSHSILRLLLLINFGAICMGNRHHICDRYVQAQSRTSNQFHWE